MCVCVTGMARMLHLEARDAWQVLSNLQGMLNNPLFSDLCLLCKDGVKVHACRLLLMARSDVLRQMLSNGMAESRMSEISLEEITSSALLPTLEYLYTGGITKHEMKPETAILVFHAANFFHLPTLEARLKSLIYDLVSSMSESPAVLAQYLSIMDSYCITHLLDDVVSVILVCLRHNCCTTHPTVFLRHLSSQAMHFLCVSLKIKNWYSTVFSFMEYICVRSLFLWGASHVSSEAEAFLECALPNEDALAMHFAALKSSGKSFLEVGLEREKTEVGGLLTAEELKHVKDVQEFLGNTAWTREELRLVCIHPVILVAVLKPLNIFDLASIGFEEVLQYQAFHAGEMNLMKWVLPPEENILNYEIQENGALLLAKMCADDELPYALTNISFTKPNGVHETSFIVEEPAPKMGIAVYCTHAYPSSMDTLMPVGSIRCEGGNLQLFTCHNESQAKQGRPITRLQKGDMIRVVVDMSKRECVFHIKGVEMVLEDLLEEVHLAACCSPSGKLRVVLVSDNTFL